MDACQGVEEGERQESRQGGTQSVIIYPGNKCMRAMCTHPCTRAQGHAQRCEQSSRREPGEGWVGALLNISLPFIRLLLHVNTVERRSAHASVAHAAAADTSLAAAAAADGTAFISSVNHRVWSGIVCETLYRRVTRLPTCEVYVGVPKHFPFYNSTLFQTCIKRALGVLI